MQKDLIGMSTPWSKIEYNWRDSALYALAVGADEDDLLYTYEKDMKAVPTFSCIPFYSAVLNDPKIPAPYTVHMQAKDYLTHKLGHEVDKGFHMAFQMEFMRPLDPIKGTLVSNMTIEKVYKFKEKDVVLEINQPIYDEAGRMVCKNTSWNILRGIQDGDEPDFPKANVAYPEREPDYVMDSYISKTANVLYRLTGDTNLAHVDPEVAAQRKQPRPFMQGLSSLGYATFLAIKAIIPGEPEKLKKVYVQMRAIAFPDTPVQLQAWKVDTGKAVFKYIDKNSGKAILSNCLFEWEE